MKQKTLENMGFYFMGVGFLALVLSLIALPYPTSAPVQEVKKAHSLKVSPLTVREHVLVAAYRYGWTGNEWTCLRQLINIENPTWSPKIQNEDSTASGIFQQIKSPSGVMFNEYSIEQQAKLGMKYIAHRFGTPCKALRYHYRKGSY
jgi:hypothetical protein